MRIPVRRGVELRRRFHALPLLSSILATVRYIILARQITLTILVLLDTSTPKSEVALYAFKKSVNPGTGESTWVRVLVYIA